MTHRVLNKHKAKSIIQIYSDVMKTIQCAHPPHHHNGFVATCRLWTASGGVHALLVLEPTECSTSTRPGGIAGMSPQSHCGDEEDGRIGLSS